MNNITNRLSFETRTSILKQAQEETYDLVIIGGGVTGCGIALDAASRGIKTLLIDKNDIASGTSSKSTKLIHGGLRYLKQFDIGLVTKTGRERAVVHRLAPHLVHPEKMLLPIIKDGNYGRLLSSFGLWLYDFLAGVTGKDKRRMLTRKQTLRQEPLLDKKATLAGFLYAEYRTDDARLCIELAKTAARFGAQILTYTNLTGFLYKDDQISGITCHDLDGDKTYEIKSKYVVSAAGPWVDKIRKLNNSINNKRLHLTKGVHIVFDNTKLPIKHSVYFDGPDGRMVFAIPRGKVTYVGTTDTTYSENPEEVKANTEDVNYLLKAINHGFPTVNLTIKDVQSTWAGLRPLIHEEGKSPSDISRKDEIFEAEDGLISIAGGKLTGYRRMALEIVDIVAKKIKKSTDKELPKSKTNQIYLTEKPFSNYDNVKRYVKKTAKRLSEKGLDAERATYLVYNYGKQSKTILNQIKKGKMKDPEETLILAELSFCLKNEIVLSSMDFLERRTGRLYFDIESARKYAKIVHQTMAKARGWDEKREMEDSEVIDVAIRNTLSFQK
ncbi:MAG: FAD-dependent oxidoreductase [Bacteroidota bacterium]